MAYQYSCEDGVEPVSDSFGEQVGNAQQYNVFTGNVLTYSASDMVVTSAAGQIVHNYVPVTTVSDTVTLVSDPTNPRWSWVGRDSTGDLVLVSGDAAAIPAVPELGDNVGIALIQIQANQTIATNCTSKLDKRVPGTSIVKYKSATQVITTNTVFADVITSGSGIASFYADANGVYDVEYFVPLAFGGTGGAKFQITGPATPTSVTIIPMPYFFTATAGNFSFEFIGVPVTAFSTEFASAASAAASGDGVYNSAQTAVRGAAMRAKLTLINGSTAGLVTLQAAQNNSNSTTTLGLGTTMTVRRIV